MSCCSNAQSCCTGWWIDARLLLNASSSRVQVETEQSSKVLLNLLWLCVFLPRGPSRTPPSAAEHAFDGLMTNNSPHVANPVRNYFSEQYWPMWCCTDTLHKHSACTSRSSFTSNKLSVCMCVCMCVCVKIFDIRPVYFWTGACLSQINDTVDYLLTKKNMSSVFHWMCWGLKHIKFSF